jgi:hypothetical protein
VMTVKLGEVGMEEKLAVCQCQTARFVVASLVAFSAWQATAIATKTSNSSLTEH